MNMYINYFIIDLENNIVAEFLEKRFDEDSFLHWLETFEVEYPGNFRLAIQVIDRSLGAHVFADAMRIEELDYDATSELMIAMGL